MNGLLDFLVNSFFEEVIMIFFSLNWSYCLLFLFRKLKRVYFHSWLSTSISNRTWSFLLGLYSALFLDDPWIFSGNNINSVVSHLILYFSVN
jgi:hypothetical protein